jgi:hypothetical protein
MQFLRCWKNRLHSRKKKGVTRLVSFGAFFLAVILQLRHIKGVFENLLRKVTYRHQANAARDSDLRSISHVFTTRGRSSTQWFIVLMGDACSVRFFL